MTRTVSKGAALAVAILIGALTLPTSAEAGRYHRHHGGNAAAAGLIGLAIGAVIGGAIARDHYYDPYYDDPYYYRPGPASYRPAPWTPEWYAYCHSKYRSFDRRSGTYQPYRGPRRFCY
ncbi:MAG: BA14K family protein [Geminicoccaceae bacterium]